ncbi:hypothetical protein PVAP13_9KG560600 [Panicum virgatum]|uniref:AP-2 complex subunit alpha n=1 Tax=Panicum virgatum TaxID=38727 RepID=A0A8T0P3L6_PANVG|nr:hypothetical protein PVAP13_9KG560600 [Panicum virgatum]
MALSGMRGLSVFISDIRNCHNKEQERLRVDKELGNIRTRFKNEKGLSPYEKKKYVWKMLYIYMLGYDVDFGHTETVSLISAPKYPEKQVGYIVTSCLLNENNDFLRMVINTVRNDIIGRNETFQCLALTMVGNTGGKEFSESLAPDVQKLLISSSCRPVVRKKAALCLLRLYRKNPDVVNIDGWADRMAQLLDERDLGVLTSVMSLFVSLVSNNAEAYWNCLPKCVRILERLARNQDIPQEYTYYGIPSPWLQVKTMRALQYFPTIEDPNARRALFEVLQRILMGTDVVKNVNKNNASHAVLFEALALVMHLDAEKEMMSQCVALLGKFIAVREPNIRYLGLENMTRMLLVTDVQDIIKRHQAQIITSLKDPDISIRRRALDLLYGMCDVTNAKEIVEELLQYLNTAEFAMREELSLKAAILAEKFAPDLSWYVDVILQLIDKAGDFVSDDIWYRVVQFVTNNEDLQPYAAAKAREYLDKPAIHETMVKVSAYLLGEYGHLLARRPGCSPKELFAIINDKLPTVSTSTVAILLSTYAKILMHTQPPDVGLQQQILTIFKKYESYIDVEIQQRAVEYFELSRKGSALADVLAEMPKFPEREPIVNVEEKFHILCTKDSGVLYEDPHIQIGLKAEWRAHHGRLVLFLGNKNTSPLMSVRALILPPSHLKMELSSVPDTIPPRAQVQVPLEVANLRASRDVAVLDFSYTFGTALVDAKLRLPVVLNKFLQPITLTPDEFFPQWKALSVHSLKVQEVVKGVKPMPLPEMANLFMSLHLAVAPGLDNNPNNMVACTTFFSEATLAMLCLIRVETDPQDRTQLRLTVASGDQYLTFELKEFIKEHLIDIPRAQAAPPPAVVQPQLPAAAPATYNDPGAMLAGLL